MVEGELCRFHQAIHARFLNVRGVSRVVFDRLVNENLSVIEGRQEFFTIKGTESPACFFACLTAFFSFGVNKGCFFDSRLDRWFLDMLCHSWSM